MSAERWFVAGDEFESWEAASFAAFLSGLATPGRPVWIEREQDGKRLRYCELRFDAVAPIVSRWLASRN